MQRALSAPGKLFVSGEYAVLWGGTARVAAVGPRVASYVRRREDGEVHLVLEEGRLVGHVTPLGVRWKSEVGPGFRFAARALSAALAAHGKEALGFELALQPSAEAAGGHKLGLGGSARACVLVAESARYVLSAKFDALKLALLAHAQEQGARGSGADVAAIFAGGLVRYRRYAVERLQEVGVPASLGTLLSRSPPVDLARLTPPRVALSYAFAGSSASTPQLIEDIERRNDPLARKKVVLTSDALGDALEDGLLRGDFEKVKESVGELQRLLASLGPLETEPIARLLALAKSYGAAGKISGAGGGDGCLLFSADTDARTALLDGLTARGVLAFPLGLESGMHGEPEPAPALLSWLRAG
jgi:phosphomevalonate kinase